MKRPLEAVVVAAQLVTVEEPHDETLDSSLTPSAGVVPSGVETRVVEPVQVLSVVPMDVMQVLRSKISDLPSGLGALAPRFVASEVKETNRPEFAIDGWELAALPEVDPSGVETRYVAGVQVLVLVDVDMSQVSWM
jgi:hypothetical protein